MTLVVGLTGGICCGKSTVAARFKEKGITVIDADQVARDVVEPHETAFQQILNHFGKQVLNSAGKLDRQKLRDIVFDQPKERIWLEKLLHPLIRARMEYATSQSKSPYTVVMVPLLIETLPNPSINRILVVDVPEAVQMERTMERDNLTREEAQKILISQVSRQERLRHADDVIVNDEGVAALKAKVDQLHQRYLQLSSSQSSNPEQKTGSQ